MNQNVEYVINKIPSVGNNINIWKFTNGLGSIIPKAIYVADVKQKSIDEYIIHTLDKSYKVIKI